MQVVEVTNRDQWDSFVKENANDSGFLQSWQWGEFQKSLGRKIWRLMIDDAAAAQIVQHPLPFGKSYFYCPRGPISEVRPPMEVEPQNIELLLKKIEIISKKENAIFFRLDPATLISAESALSAESAYILGSLGFHKTKHEVQPKQTLILDISKSEEELLAAMHPKTRYNIKVAERHDVKIKCLEIRSLNIEIGSPEFEAFWNLLQETAKRDRFRTHPKEYYEKLTNLPTYQLTNLFIAKYQDKIIAANIVAFYNNWALYLHGASSYEHRNLMAPYLLHWQTILEAKKRNCKFYDFWGVDEKKWPGITRFKTSFSPQTPITSYVGTWEYPLSSFWYSLYRISKLV